MQRSICLIICKDAHYLIAKALWGFQKLRISFQPEAKLAPSSFVLACEELELDYRCWIKYQRAVSTKNHLP